MSDFHGSKSRAKARLLRVKEARLTSRADGGDNTALATSKMEGGVSSPKQVAFVFALYSSTIISANVQG